jgi:hypothetical protein
MDRLTPEGRQNLAEAVQHQRALYEHERQTNALPRALRYVARASQCCFKAGWADDAEAWQNWCVENYGWSDFEYVSQLSEANPLPRYESNDGQARYLQIAEHCVHLALEALVIVEQPKADSLWALWRRTGFGERVEGVRSAGGIDWEEEFDPLSWTPEER